MIIRKSRNQTAVEHPMIRGFVENVDNIAAKRWIGEPKEMEKSQLGSS
jgi:hypothetical protein